MKTWICKIFGGGTPLYLVSAEDEKRAWRLIRKELANTCEAYRQISYELRDNSGGLVEFDGWTSNEERIVDICEVYAPKGITKQGTFEGLE